MAKNDFDAKCFKCVAELNSKGNGGAANILLGKMNQGLAGQDLDNIQVCEKHR